MQFTNIIIFIINHKSIFNNNISIFLLMDKVSLFSYLMLNAKKKTTDDIFKNRESEGFSLKY